MSKKQSQLKDIVKLKKQIAESEFRSAQNDLNAMDACLTDKRTQIERASSSAFNATGIELQSAQLFVAKQFSEIQQLQEQREALAVTLEQARLELQGIIMSENVLEGS